jgi:histidinol-phosphate aminotransferase
MKTELTSRRNWLKISGLTALTGLTTKSETLAFPDKIRPDTDGMIHLDKNENPFGVSPKAQKAIQDSTTKAFRYMVPANREKLEQKLADRENLSASNFVITAGSIEVLGITAVFVARKGGSVVCPYPTFPSLPNHCKNLGMDLINVPVSGNQMIDLAALKNAIRDDTKLVYLCNPNNPTGTVLDTQALRDFVEEVSKKTMVMVDEAYFEFLQQSVSDMVKTNKNVLISRTFSKVYGFAGVRVGYLIGHSATMAEMKKYQTSGSIGVSLISMNAAIAALDDKEFLSMYLAKNREAATYTVNALNEMGVRAIPTNANFVFFSLDNYKGKGDFEQEMKNRKILMHGDYKELDGSKWGRVSIGRLDEMKVFIDAVKQIWTM